MTSRRTSSVRRAGNSWIERDESRLGAQDDADACRRLRQGASLRRLAPACRAGSADAKQCGARHAQPGPASTFVRSRSSQCGSSIQERRRSSTTHRSAPAASRRSTNRTVDFGACDAPMTPRPAHRTAGLRPDVRGRSPRRPCSTTCAASRTISTSAAPYRRHLPRQDLEVERPADQEAQPGRQPARPRRSRPCTAATARGTTFNFTDFLSASSKTFGERIGHNTAVDWPKGVGGRAARGVSAILTRTAGAIGYADIAYALTNKLQFADDPERVGQVRAPGHPRHQGGRPGRQEASTRATSCSIVEPAEGEEVRAAPIRSAPTRTRSCRPSRKKAAELKSFVTWAMTCGQAYGGKLLFFPIPTYVVARDKDDPQEGLTAYLVRRR